jgi:hypothetical protein
LKRYGHLKPVFLEKNLTKPNDNRSQSQKVEKCDAGKFGQKIQTVAKLVFFAGFATFSATFLENNN